MNTINVNTRIKAMLGATFLFAGSQVCLQADEMSEKREALERQIAELEAKQQKQKEIKELERKLQTLRANENAQNMQTKPTNYTNIASTKRGFTARWSYHASNA